jgi:hypothetical protein
MLKSEQWIAESGHQDAFSQGSFYLCLSVSYLCKRERKNALLNVQYQVQVMDPLPEVFAAHSVFTVNLLLTS